VGKPKGKRPFRRARHRWEDNSKKDLQEVELGGQQGMDWIDLALNRDMWWVLVNMVMNLLVPLNVWIS